MKQIFSPSIYLRHRVTFWWHPYDVHAIKVAFSPSGLPKLVKSLRYTVTEFTLYAWGLEFIYIYIFFHQPCVFLRALVLGFRYSNRNPKPKLTLHPAVVQKRERRQEATAARILSRVNLPHFTPLCLFRVIV